MLRIFNWLLMILPFALWGTAMAAMSPLVQSGGPEIVAFLRLFPAGLVILFAIVFLNRSWKIARSDFFWFSIFTLVDGTLFQFCLTHGIAKTGAGLGSVFIDSQPLLVALLARFLFKDAINPIGWIGLSIGLGGIICLGVSPELLQNWFLMGDKFPNAALLKDGELWMLSAAITMALGTVLIRFVCRESDPIAVTGWHMVFGSLPLILWHVLTDSWPIVPDWSLIEWSLMAYTSLLGSALAYGLFFWFANNKELTTFSTLAFLTPVFALLSGGYWLGERLVLFQWFGVLLVLLSVFLVSQRRRLWNPSYELNVNPDEAS